MDEGEESGQLDKAASGMPPDRETPALADGLEHEEVALEHGNGWNAYETLEQFLIEDGWYPSAIEGTTSFRSGFRGESGKFRVICQINVELEQLYLYVIADVNVPEQARALAAEFITRANYGMRIGNFEMDYTDGEVRYKSSIDFEGEVLTRRLIQNAIAPAVSTIDRYFPSLMRVAFGGSTPAEAVAEVEGRPQQPGE